MIKSVLVVCVGNICRSPYGRAPVQTRAAATCGLRRTRRPGWSTRRIRRRQVAAEEGLSLEGHEAQRLTASLCREYDLILVMEKRHIEQVNRIDPAARGKTMLLGHWLNQKECGSVQKKP
ncbi:protein tyrosine phosphatase [Pantoea ananatis]